MFSKCRPFPNHRQEHDGVPAVDIVVVVPDVDVVVIVVVVVIAVKIATVVAKAVLPENTSPLSFSQRHKKLLLPRLCFSLKCQFSLSSLTLSPQQHCLIVNIMKIGMIKLCHLNDIEFVNTVKMRITKKQMLPGRASERLILPFRRSTINEIFNVNTWSHHENVKVIKKRSPRPLRDSYYLSDDYSLAWRVFAVIINFVNDAVKLTNYHSATNQNLKTFTIISILKLPL